MAATKETWHDPHALDPNDEQMTYFARTAGAARKVQDWAPAEWNRQYQAGEKPNEMALRKNFFEGRAQFPNFKQKGIRDGFRADNGPQRKGADAVVVENSECAYRLLVGFDCVNRYASVDR